MVSHVRLSDHAIADATWGAWGLQIAFNDLSFWRQAQVPATCTSLSFTAFHCLSLHCLVPFTAFRCLSLRFHCLSLHFLAVHPSKRAAETAAPPAAVPGLLSAPGGVTNRHSTALSQPVLLSNRQENATLPAGGGDGKGPPVQGVG